MITFSKPKNNLLMKNSLLLFFFLTGSLFLDSVVAQDGYKTAIGARLGSPLSASAKYFISEKGAIEAYVGTTWWYSGYNSISVNAAYQIHEPLEIEDFEGLRYYYGFGAGAQFWRYNSDFIDPGSDISLSLSGYIGLDYYFDDMPLNVSIDWRPTLFLGSILSPFGARYGSISVRYILGSDNNF
ncbi:MAG: hypothetical protein ACI8YQ_001619 [Polaribacter sp.]|jgi:hypothetical protein